ncbi:hypothetical protein BK049_04395 [Bacillus xiamenensis]|uniref:Uncharacterized protein n=1 Tax=Bacillus xiamenensis TaxID=1178537 RepID=A0AAC9IID1_9BACI|nr:hypothetical protein BK049_04395 [Bacillus xiamenensis]MBG9911626.1 hypothetical protein [Bacillus xiamenensis]
MRRVSAAMQALFFRSYCWVRSIHLPYIKGCLIPPKVIFLKNADTFAVFFFIMQINEGRG